MSDRRLCVRCGIARRTNHGRETSPLCLDCTVVARDLDELERWTA